MRNYLSLGSVSVRISRKGIAPWGYPLLQVGGLTFGAWHSDGRLGLAAYHPRKSATWHWSIAIGRSASDERGPWISRAEPKWRRGQWHDYYRLPFRWKVIVGQQDYHLAPKPVSAP